MIGTKRFITLGSLKVVLHLIYLNQYLGRGRKKKVVKEEDLEDDGGGSDLDSSNVKKKKVRKYS